MKKLKTLGITAFTIAALCTPLTANAAASPPVTVVQRGNGYIIGIGGNIQLPSLPDCNLPSVPDFIFPGFGSPDCDIPGMPDIDVPGTDAPDDNLPEQEYPDGSLPDTGVPDDNVPEDNLPDGGAPEGGLPDGPAEDDQPDDNGPGTDRPDDGNDGTNKPDGSLPDGNLPDSPPENDQPEDGGNGTETPDDQEDSYMARVAGLVNIERAKYGLSPLEIDSSIEKAAMVRAKEIQSSFSHTRPNGSSFSTALKEAGVSYRTSGENIAWGQSTPTEVVEAWMNSSGHRANILNAGYTRIGVGYLTNSYGTPYWVQLFAG